MLISDIEIFLCPYFFGMSSPKGDEREKVARQVQFLLQSSHRETTYIQFFLRVFFLIDNMDIFIMSDMCHVRHVSGTCITHDTSVLYVLFRICFVSVCRVLSCLY